MAKAKTTKQAKAETVTIGGKTLNVKENKNSMKEAQKETKIEAKTEIITEQSADASLMASLNVQAKLMQDILARLEALETPKLVGTIAQEPVEPKPKAKAETVKVSAKAKAKAKKAEKKASKKAKVEPQAKAEIVPGVLTVCKNKAEKKRLLSERPLAGNSTKFACVGAEGLACKGFGYHEAFATKHMDKGHNVIQMG
jgi:hypothetical protein